ncbi:dihydropteroate synthase [Candidatus Magnetoovum chiemensis]|nr:dihydropteroate synthase [Candidatus Magnetoovum chiemensis]
MKLVFKNFDFDLSKKPLVMGILNITPDSFSDGGLYLNLDNALAHTDKMIKDGANMIDIGGESTRPGADPLNPDEESRRIVPVIEAITKRFPSVPISVDTYKSIVAQRTIEAGAAIINDVYGLRYNEDMAEIIAKHNIPVVIMHMKGTPANMQLDTHYDNLIEDILNFFKERIAFAVKSGIKKEMIIIDPGIGFGKTIDHNLEILDNLPKFKELNCPILMGTSRKFFIGTILGDVPITERLIGSAATAVISVYNGASIIRAHDVKETLDAVKIAYAVKYGYKN